MTQKYYPPEYKKDQFHCILCSVFASQTWFHLEIEQRAYRPEIDADFEGSYCSHCRKFSFWYDGKMVIPSDSPIELPHQDLPKDCVSDYLEARDVFSKSSRASVALLRLCIQKIMPHLGGKGKNINQDIGKLVKDGLSPTIQKALDVCRVVGNNAVHPGEINLKDSPEIAQKLFSLINFIIEDRITKPKEIENLYSSLPKNSKNAVEKRDNK